MSTRSIKLSIAPATDTTCGDGTGRFCPYVVARRLGTEWVCTLGFDQELKDENGWLMRTAECLAAEKRSL